MTRITSTFADVASLRNARVLSRAIKPAIKIPEPEMIIAPIGII